MSDVTYQRLFIGEIQIDLQPAQNSKMKITFNHNDPQSLDFHV